MEIDIKWTPIKYFIRLISDAQDHITIYDFLMQQYFEGGDLLLVFPCGIQFAHVLINNYKCRLFFH
jgi:hypothetical protein